MSTPMVQRLVGSSVLRSEDLRILSGRGTYIDDVQLPNMLHATFVRSPYAHARITGIDLDAARALPGVELVLTGDDLEALLGTTEAAGTVNEATGEVVRSPMEFTTLATDKVRLVGDPVVLVVATSRYVAEDAAELVEIDYESLPPVPDIATALDPSSHPVFDGLGGNIVTPRTTNTHGDIDAVFARADFVVKERIEQHRHQNVPMECRGCVADFDTESGRLTHHSANQGVGLTQMALAGKLGLDRTAVRVVCKDIGGSFGLKIGAAREEIAVAVASRELHRPVKWIEDRNEHLAASGQAREETLDLEFAVTADGRILGMKVDMIVDTGAYPGMGGMLGGIVERMMPGPYMVEALEFSFTAVVTNKASYVAYRGPWAAETFTRERMFDVVAERLGIEPLELRLRNVRAEGEDPGRMITGATLEGATTRRSLEELRTHVDIPAFRARQTAARDEGRYLGIGIATYLEAAPGPKGDNPLGRERMRMDVQLDGTVNVYTGQMPHGQGHETTLAQVAADQLGVPFEQVRVVVGDSDRVPMGFTGGSRSATFAGGGSLHTARALRQKIADVAAHLLEAAVEDIEIVDGRVGVVGVPASSLSFGQIAVAAAEAGRLPDGVDAGLEVTFDYDGGEGGWSIGTHCAIVEVDVETGLVEIERWVVVEDCGVMINPAVVEGQVRGGVAQGIGAVLLEKSAYDEEGNFLSGTFMDYLLPSTTEVPRIEIHHLETVPMDPDVNFRGIGEGGMIVSPPALVNAIQDALAPFGVRITEQHLPPLRILELIGAIDDGLAMASAIALTEAEPW